MNYAQELLGEQVTCLVHGVGTWCGWGCLKHVLGKSIIGFMNIAIVCSLQREIVPI